MSKENKSGERQIRSAVGPLEKARDEELKRQQQRDLQVKRLEFDKKVEELAEKTLDFTLEYGEEDYRSQMMMSFLEVALQMKDVIDLIQGVQTAFDCINEAVGFMDGVMEFNVQIQESMLQNEYGFMSKIKNKRRMKRVIKNNRNRLNATVNQILGIVGMASDMTIALRGASVRMQNMLGKGNAKMDKKKKKFTGGETGSGSAAKKLIGEMMEKRGIKPAEQVSGSEGSQSSGDGGVGDISDII